MNSMLKSVALLLERYDSRIHLGVARYAGRHRWHLNVHMVNTADIPYGWKGDGMITALDQREDLVKFIRHARIPKVDVSIARPDIDIPRIIGDNEQIGRLAAEHLLDRGLRRFAWFSGKFGNVERLRYKAFSEGVEARGCSCARIVCSGFERDRLFAGNWRKMCEWIGKSLAGIPKPMGVFAFNDYDAATVVDACNTLGLAVPDDVAVLGVDNNELVCDCQSVAISSVNHDLERMGYEAAALLDRLMKGGRASRDCVLVSPRGITLRRSTDTMAINDVAVRAAVMFVRSNFSRSFTVEDIAMEAGVSRRVLERLFMKELQHTIHDEVLGVRLNHARDSLTNTRLSVADVAAKSGFCHAQHMNNTFRKRFGLTPLKYRKKFSVTP